MADPHLNIVPHTLEATGDTVTIKKQLLSTTFGTLMGNGLRALGGFPWALGRVFNWGGGTRNLYETFGWDVAISAQACWEMYYRGGIAKRIIHAFPEATWGNPPKVTATKGWTSAWDDLVLNQQIWSNLNRLDKLSRLGQYAVLIIGTDSGRLEDPVVPGKASKVTFVQPYSSRAAVISQWGTDQNSPYFGMPTQYTINPAIARMEAAGAAQQNLGTGFGGVSPVEGSFKVHASRVIHVAQDNLESPIYGTPMFWSTWNYLTDLMKVVGGSAESYWMTANRGMHVNLDKEMQLDAAGEANLAAEIQAYVDGQARFIRTRGVEVKSLGAETADPKGSYSTLIDLIAGTYGIPQRVLVGSESAHAASTQDKAAWAERVLFNINLSCNPKFILPLIQSLMVLGVLPTVKLAKIQVEWPDAYILSPLERGQMENQNATAANNWALAVRNVTNLANVEELRKKIGLGDEDGTIVPGTEAAIPVGTPDQKGAAEGDGVVDPGSEGAAKTGNGSGTTATPTSDSNGSGGPIQKQK